MKKLITSLLVALLAVSICAAVAEENEPGELLFNGMPVLGFMDLPYDDVIDILGEPIDLSEVAWFGVFAEYADMTLFFPNETNELANFIARNPGAFAIDEVSMAKTREELIGIFGEPIYEGEYEPYEGHIMIFEIGDYCFWFTLLNEGGRVISFEIWDTTNEHAGYGV